VAPKPDETFASKIRYAFDKYTALRVTLNGPNTRLSFN